MLTDIGYEVLKALTHDVRVVSTDLIGKHLFQKTKEPRKSAAKLVRKLACDDYVTTQNRTIIGIDPHEPLLVCDPSKRIATDVLAKIAYANSRRWKQDTEEKLTVLVQATEKAKVLFGGKARTCRDTEIEHDLALASVFFRQAFRKPEAHWNLEDQGLFNNNDYRPDAKLTEDRPVLIEVVGRGYSAAKLTRIVTAPRTELLALY